MNKGISPFSKKRQEYLKGTVSRKHAILLGKIAIIVSLFGLWQLGSSMGWINSFILSSPIRLIASIWGLVQSGQLWQHLWITTYEVVIGFLLGSCLGIFIAILLWAFPMTNKILEPYLVVINSLPKIALGPVFIVWFGAGSSSIIAITVAISLVVTIMEVLAGFLATDQSIITLLKSMGANKMGILSKIVLPANIPTILNSLKVSVGMSWVGVIVGEFLVSRGGLGYLIVYGSQVFKMDLVMASVFILAVECTIMYFAVAFVEKKFCDKQNRNS